MIHPPAHHGSAWTRSDDRKLLALHARGRSAADIARELGRTVPSVYQRLSTRSPALKRSRL